MGKRRPCTEEQKRERDVLASKKGDVSFCKRRKTVFSKALKLCGEHGTRIAVLVLSPRGKPYAFGHTSVDAVLNRSMSNKIKKYVQQSRASVINEERNMVERMKEGIENELKACQTFFDTWPCLNGCPTSGYGNYVVYNHAYYGKNNNGDDGSSWGFEYVENIMPNSLSQSSDGNYIRGGHAYGNNSYGGEESSWGTECIENVGIGSDVLVLPVLSRDCRDDQEYGEDMCGEGSYNILQNMELGHDPDDNVNNPFEATINLSGSLSTDNSLFMDSPYPLPINTSPVPSLDSRLGSTDDQAYGSDISSWEGSYDVLGNIGLGQADPDNDNSFGSTIYLPGHLFSNPSFPTCPSPSIFGAGHHDLDDEDVPFDVSSPGAMVCPPTNGTLFVPLIGSS
ncbi:hypothetical protein ACLB2K_045965 [Fragaria x ananassa]